MKKGCLIGCSGIVVVFVLLFIIGLVGAIRDTVNKNDEEKAKSVEEEIEKQKEYYLNSTKTEIKEVLEIYDQAWEEEWRPTFEAFSNGNANIYTVYNNLKNINEVYRDLSVSVKGIPVEELSKEHQEKLKSAFNDLSYACTSRQLASEKAMEMVDTNNFSPSLLEKLKNEVDTSDSHMLSAITTITSVELELGIIQEENQEATN